MKRILLTGACGYLGSRLRPLFPTSSVVNCDLRLYGGGAPNLLAKDFADLNDGDMEDVDTVIHLADYRLSAYSSEKVFEQRDRNKTFFELLRRFPIETVICNSSCRVYGFTDQLCDERSPTSTTSPYAEAKLDLENIVRDYTWDTGRRAVVLRFGTAYGPSPAMRFDLLVNEMAQKFQEKQPIKMYSLGSIRPFLHVYDMARAVHWATMQALPTGVYNVVQDNLTKSALLELFGESGVSVADTFKKDPRNYKVSAEKLAATRFTYMMDMKAGVKDLVEYLKLDT